MMLSKTVKVGSTLGLHVRAATTISEAALRYDDPIWVSLAGDDEESVDATSSLLLMSLGAETGAEVTVSSDNETAVEEIAALVELNLDDK